MNEPSTQTNTENPFSKWFEVHEKLGVSLIMHLFNRLDGAYPHWWRSNFAGQDAIDNWAVTWSEAFEDNGITPADIKTGLKACCAKHDKPPSCAEFVKSCRPVIDSLKAYYEAVAGIQERRLGRVGVWTHPAVYWASVPLSFDLGTQTYSQMKTRWERSFFEQMERGEWGEIPVPVLALPEPKISREEADSVIAKLKAETIIKQPGNDSRYKDWAHKIKAREKRGDKTLQLIQISFANTALGIIVPPRI